MGRLFEAVAVRRSQQIAITSSTQQSTFAELHAGTRNIADRLISNPAFRLGDRVVSLLPNSPEYVAVFYGVLMAGGVVVPVPPKIEETRLRHIVDSTAASFVITSSQVVKSRPDLQLLGADDLDIHGNAQGPDQSSIQAHTPAGKELAAIFFTAGSTGSPKGVMLSHRNLISNARAIQRYLQIGDAERPLCVLPFHHAFGNSVLQSHILAGAQIVLDGQTTFPESLVDALRNHDCTSFSGVPDLFRMLLERSSLGQTKLPQLRYMAVAGGSLRHELSLEVQHRIAPATFFVMYGQTEATARLAYLPPDCLDSRSDCDGEKIGRAVSGVVLEVVDEQGAAVSPGEIGELRARGPNVMLGYWQDPEATSERLREGWLYTGDLATVDAQGWIIHKGRRNSLVKIAGFRVHPADLEEFAMRRFSVNQAVAVAFEARHAGTRLALYLNPGAKCAALPISEMISRCRSELPRHLVPDVIQIVEEFPLTDALKIDRPALSRLAEQLQLQRN